MLLGAYSVDHCFLFVCAGLVLKRSQCHLTQHLLHHRTDATVSSCQNLMTVLLPLRQRYVWIHCSSTLFCMTRFFVGPSIRYKLVLICFLQCFYSFIVWISLVLETSNERSVAGNIQKVRWQETLQLSAWISGIW